MQNPFALHEVSHGKYEAKYKKLRKGYNAADAINFPTLAKEDERKLCETLMKELFQQVDIDMNEYQSCF